MRPLALLDGAGVFAQCHVAHVVRTVFDPPVAATPLEELGRPSPVGRKTGDPVLDFFVRWLARLADGAHDPDHLLQSGPVGLAGESCRCLQAAALDATVGLVLSLGDIKMLDAGRFVRRGKKPAETQP